MKSYFFVFAPSGCEVRVTGSATRVPAAAPQWSHKGRADAHRGGKDKQNRLRRRTVGQRPVKAAKTLGMFRPPESFNSARIERMTPSMDSSLEEQSIDGVIYARFEHYLTPLEVETCPEFWPPSPVSGLLCRAGPEGRSINTQRGTDGKRGASRNYARHIFICKKINLS